MKHHTRFYFFLFVLMTLITACGGDVTTEDRSVDTPDEPIQHVTFHGCTPWKADASIHDLYVNEDYDTVREVYGLALAPNPIVTVMTYQYTALAEYNGSSWQITKVPEKVARAERLRRDGDTLYMTGITMEKVPLLFSRTGGSWTEIPVPQGVAEIKNIWVFNGSLLLLGETDEMTPTLNAWQDGQWQEQALPDLDQAYRIHGLWNLGDNLFTFGALLDDEGFASHGLALIRDANGSWQQLAVPEECELVKSVHGLDMDHLAVSGQTIKDQAVFYRVTNQQKKWTAHLDKNLFAYSSLWWLDEDHMMISGHTNPHISDTYGNYTNLWAVDIEEKVDSKFLQEVSGYPREMNYEPTTHKVYLLTGRDLYSRTCR